MADTELVRLPPGMLVMDLSDKSEDARGNDVSKVRVFASTESDEVTLEMTPEMRTKLATHGYDLEPAGKRRGRPPKAARVAPSAPGAVA